MIPTYYAGGERPLTPDDISQSEAKIIEQIIIKSPTIPTASADTVGEVRQYVSETTSSYTHGYIYECTAGDTIYTGTVTFQPATISGTVVTCDGDVFANFVATGGDDPEAVVSGTMTYHYASSIWVLSGLDADGNEVAHRQIYQPDYEDVGFTFTGTPADGDVVAFECTVTEDHTEYSWERIDVQPGGSRGRFLAIWNCSTGLAESNPPTSPYPYATGDYFIVGTVGATNYKPSGSSYVIGTASTTVETNEVKVDDTYYFDGTNWKLQSNTSKTVTFAGIAGDIYDNSSATTALNAKQDTISDLNTIRSGASAGATAVQPAALSAYQTTSNLVTSISSSSTDTQYPSAKCVYDIVGNIETVLQGI